MRKRLLCAVLALMMVVAMLPATAVTAFAQSEMVSSDELINCLKEYEGFRSEAYLSGGVWSIGYGTSAKPGDTVTATEAEQALRAHLHSLEATVNRFADKNGLKLTQNQFDALVTFSYNCGVVWMNQDGLFRNAVVKGASEQEFLYAISLWANNGNAPDPGLLLRRMAEADMYLNGVYGKRSETYTYTIFDANGGTPGSAGQDKMQGYRKGGQTSILVKDPTLAGYSFAGWFTEKNGGTQVTQLGSATAGKRLYAHYRSNGDSTWNGETEVSGSDGNTTALDTGRVKCTTYVNIRKGAGTGNAIVSRAANGTKVEIFQTTMVGSYKWGRTQDGWICMDYVELEGSGSNDASDSGNGSNSGGKAGIVSAYNVNVRSGPGTQYGVVSRITNGQKVTVYEEQTSGGLNWGRIGTSQWACMTYIRLESSSDSSGNTSGNTGSTAESGTVTGKVNAVNLNVRSGPGMGYARVGSFGKGMSVTIFEQTTANGSKWGRVANDRWVCMDYITLTESSDSASGSSNSEEKGETGTGTVISRTNLNIRSGAGLGCNLVGRLSPGTKVEIRKQTKVNGIWWGETPQGWVCMDYIQMGTSSWN